jgi:hypothetical protein
MLKIRIPNGHEIEAFTPAPEIVGEKLAIPEFDSTGKAYLDGLELVRYRC